MRPRERKYNITKKDLNNKSTWFERNQGFIQFIMVLLTSITILVSSYFSWKSTQQTETQLSQGIKQLLQAEEQLKLAQKQFNETKKQFKIAVADKIKSDLIEQYRYEIQNEINQKNLKSVDLQAKVAQQQYNAQIQAVKDLAYQNRPIFTIHSVNYDANLKIATFEIKNVGKRTAKISYSRFTCYNPEIQNNFNLTTMPWPIEINEDDKYALKLNVEENVFYNNETQFMIVINYYDFGTKNKKVFQKYFYFRENDGNVSWRDIDEFSKVAFYLKLSKFYNIEEADPSYNYTKE